MKALVNFIAKGGCSVFVLVGYMVLSHDLSAQQLIKDINRSDNPEVNEYAQAIDINGTVFFNSFNDLWVTKGTRESSLRLKRFKTLSQMVRVGPRIYFAADGGEGVELWRSDGTRSGTVLVKDIYAGTSSSSPGQLTAVGNAVYFIADDGASGKEIWKSNGTASGTLMVKDILRGKGTSSPSALTNVNGKLFFSANDGLNSYELWKSDGSSAGTHMIKDINSAPKLGSFPKFLTNVGGVLFFTATDTIAGRELWKSDGTAAGTIRVKDIVSGPVPTYIKHLTAVGSRLFFAADDKVHGMELWKSDGTSSGTVLVKDLTPGAVGSSSRSPFSQSMSSFTNIRGKLYFNAYMRGTFYYWKSDGTEAGTVPFYRPTIDGLMNPTIQSNFTFLNNSVYFNDVARDQYADFVTIYTLREDPSGVVSRVSSLLLDGFYGSRNQLMLTSGNYLYMSGRSGLAQGYALFKTDGFSQAQKVVDAYSQRDQSSSPDLFTRVGNKIYFRATFDYGEGRVSQSLWVTDGTNAGTRKIIELKGLSVGTGLESIREITAVDSLIYFVGLRNDAYDIFRSDGTTEGTYPLRIARPSEGRVVRRLTGFKGKLYYFWTTYFDDGPQYFFVRSNNVTTELGEFVYPSTLTPAGDYVYFTSRTEELGTELYRSDGTVAGTKLVKDIFRGAESSDPSQLTSYKDYLFFSANDGVHGAELWRSSGTAASTVLLKNLSTTNATNGTGGVQHFQVVNGELYFTSNDLTLSFLWKSDGTSSGTLRISKINRPVILMDGGTILYFITSSDGPFELWRSGGANGVPSKLFELNTTDPLYAFDYTRKDSTIFLISGHPLIQSNGTACGTFKIPVTTSGTLPIDILGNNLIFGSFRADIGTELFKLHISDIPDPCLDLISISETSRRQSDAVSLYPNPFDSEFVLYNADSNKVLVRIYDAQQNIVDETEVSPSETRSLGAAWRPGIYLLSMRAQGKTRMYRVVKKP